MSATETLITYYGDDLTGSTDALEALSSRGVPTVLFTAIPDDEQLARFAACRAIGLAGTSRSESPAWMHEHLTSALSWLRERRAGLCHYKTCSTFDSAPGTGSIGCALEIGRDVFGQACVPIVVGVPQMKRYTAFGQLFAAYRGDVYRIDRHPVMAHHPVTPMREADLRRHLAAQTALDIGLADLASLTAEDIDQRVDDWQRRHQALLYDVIDEATQASVGHQLWRTRQAGGSYVVGSSGVEYALIPEWRNLGLIGPPPSFADPGGVERIAVVSGSCSETTARQIDWAKDHGFQTIAVNAARLADPATGEAARDEALQRGLGALQAGVSVILHTALGPDAADPMLNTEQARHGIGRRLGEILRELVIAEGLTRVVVAGGDTSSHAIEQLGIHALTTRLPLPETPGSPLCMAYSDDARFDGLEIAFKGGQIGSDSYFAAIRDGGRTRH
ncbi:four-carbon acid sugar kinase family protein [Halomonas sp. McH1-25]|uniref:four-carbon acid sugar kinase family protein n=1 Tax=unclassified Halomonas TaxID=2609666 RepID=UPI001EF642A8|nr:MULTISPECIES: four-carbon acid sugar kinase family protein [unclassified Halomonas]MCG7599363.1 four-carbon acid sugar kinase family protein [Halomonas sp. McH1-25]MCP1343811.1 four-carbon acid sugar kinase family protein [Halomonas sp. FL8]MCP1361144.1 four-carbon acid sugar kinase family protein [Halomonas sp. BBD45]MCP1365870.1 four-carbon acid sugar kinase family protein [Halomonas sp. BBD48]